MITREQLRAALEHRRPGVTSDEDWGQLTVIKEYEHLPIEGKTLLDVGGNIGAFACRAAMEKCKKVVTYEPHPDNFHLLCLNTYPWAELVVPVKAALVTHEEKEVDLWLTNERTMGSCSTTAFRGRTPIKVPVQNFQLVVYLLQPDGIKMDCEGSELLAIKGMSRILMENKDLKMIIEFFPLLLEKMGSNPKDLFDILNNRFKIYIIPNDYDAENGVRVDSYLDLMKHLIKVDSHLNLYLTK